MMVSHSLSLSILCKILNPKLSALNDARKQWEVEERECYTINP